ncbi:Nicotinamidase-related amidase [Bradyrhizobium sp. Rc3b]|uniref:cysteine hydrolase family protein n=1 Tax=unclassified Bradyrhizobium TaxID=2631580 RepID=UPI0008E6969E|nr:MULTISPECIES: isochorismatase family cysteine hydrolase [unclassified Bradyrhizobium]MBB4375409.1 nicotinamidase-related amidase [Bradyrhizobium sp. SBR1B]SFN30945.1 Nicotinamidase-related amidase [Bradyrhizobium sp. Rc3b]
MRDSTSEVAEVREAVHLCIDMQNIFAPGGLWATPWMERVLPAIVSIVARHQARTIFTRFITPQDPEDRPGQWQSYFHRWSQATRKHLPPSALELVPALSKFVPPAAMIDKPAYSAFSNPALAGRLIDKNVGTVVITGAETDVCVLSTVLSAVDLGFRVVIVEDALCSSSDVGHDALMTMYRTRFHGQVDLVTTEELAEFWRE